MRALARFAPLLLVAACLERPPAAPAIPVLDDLGNGNWAMVTTGQDHTCALTTDGRPYCWGSNAAGQLGVSRSDTTCDSSGTPCVLAPVAVETTLRFRDISAGSRHTCAIAVDRAVWCWGDNSHGALGVAAPGGPVPIRVSSTLGFSDISAGFDHTCAVRTDGVGFCWGSNNRGQLGTGDTSSSFTPLRTARRLTLAAISAGFGRTCARTTNGTVYCWGAIWLYNSGGLDYTQAQTFPSLVPGAPRIVSLSVGSFTTCGLDALGAAFCWEGNAHGEMGDGTTSGSQIATRVAGDIPFVSISAGLLQTCAIAATGAGYCWGDDTFGQLGLSPRALGDRCGRQELPCSMVPVPVYGRQRFVSMGTGLGSHSCGVTTTGNLYCWGLNSSGQLGEGVLRIAEVVPTLVRPPGGS